MEAQVGASLSPIVADRGYRGHNAPPDHKMKVYISGQKRGVTEAIKPDLRKPAKGVEPVIGHAKSERRRGRNFLKGTHGEAANAVLAAAGYSFRRLLAWLAILWRAFVMALLANASDTALADPADAKPSVKPRRRRQRALLHGRRYIWRSGKKKPLADGPGAFGERWLRGSIPALSAGSEMQASKHQASVWAASDLASCL
jgi:hypothetical protein